jgi:hypothetical protein
VADQNLADMAFRLEAALRRPSAEASVQSRAPAVEAPEPVAEPARSPRAETRAARIEPKLESKIEPAKPGYVSLEQEMASLLGRPTGKVS